MQFNLRKNTLWALAEVIGSGLVLFLLYKVVVKSLGVKALGIWSLVLATTSIGRLADLGAGAGLNRFIAAAGAKNNQDRSLVYVETTVITNAVLYSTIAILIAAPAYYGLSFAMTGDSLFAARQLLPYSLVSFVLMSIASTTMGAVMGQHRSHQKSKITLLGLAVQLLLSVLLVPQYGLLALAWAQIAQYVTLIALGWALFLRNHFGSWKFLLPLRWRKDAFLELVGFGIGMQAISLAVILYDPIVKFLLSAFGGLEMLGLFEMAQRLVLQVRQLVIMPNQALVPSFAHLAESDPQLITPLYHKAMALSLAFGVVLLGGVAVCSPLISLFWIGHIDYHLVIFAVILAGGWFLNLVAAPAYLLGVGIGSVKWNVRGAWITTGGVAGVGYLLGHLWDGIGVALSAAFMQAAGSLVIMIMNCRMMTLRPFPDKKDACLILRKLLSSIRTKRN